MDTQELNFLSREVVEPHSDIDAALAAPAQPPLSERETIGFYRAMQQERDKRQGLENQLAELKAAGDVALTTSAERDLGVTVYANNLRVSRRFAEREYGREVVTAIHDWAAAKCDADPIFNAKMRSSDDPYEAAKNVYDQEQTFRSIQEPVPATYAHTLFTTLPPRSLADAPGNGALGKPRVLVGDGNAYESLFK